MPGHLIDIERAGIERCTAVLETARQFREELAPLPSVSGAIALAFFEPSTRTRMSFELAAKRLGAQTVTFSAAGSSIEKGESFRDTICTIEALNVAAIVIRHRASDAAEYAATIVQHAVVINAGDGMHEHPTQALLDARTLLDVFGELRNRRIAIVGDILHSRVFRSDVMLFGMLGAKIGVCAPPLLRPRALPYEIVELPDAQAALQWADAVVVLRLQRERMHSGLVPSLADYRQRWSINAEDLEHSDAYLLHPGPVNIGVELDAEAVEHPRSLIRRQVTNGVYVRMAVITEALGL
jgi:aspartate carbamoyltransferase catalytic subunit